MTVADDVRYGLYTFINASETPRELRVREALKPLAEIQDLTSAYIRYLQKMEEFEAVSQPVWLGQRGMLRRPYRR